jgi:hypothetical protein
MSAKIEFLPVDHTRERDLLRKAANYGLSQDIIIEYARQTYRVSRLADLTPEQFDTIEKKLPGLRNMELNYKQYLYIQQLFQVMDLLNNHRSLLECADFSSAMVRLKGACESNGLVLVGDNSPEAIEARALKQHDYRVKSAADFAV